jgi:hypothetical protein
VIPHEKIDSVTAARWAGMCAATGTLATAEEPDIIVVMGDDIGRFK